MVEPAEAIAGGRVRVDGAIVTNPASMVRRGAALVVAEPVELRGSAKLRAGLDASGVIVEGRVCLDIGAAAGGFTRVLLEAGAAKVYAVDAGHGQLLGSLRQHPRVVNLEATNVGDLDRVLVPDAVDVVTLDVSYLALGEAVRQLERVELAPSADLIGLVKPMFELRLSSAPSDPASLDRALRVASDAIAAAGWHVGGWTESPVRGAKGAPERLVWAKLR